MAQERRALREAAEPLGSALQVSDARGFPRLFANTDGTCVDGLDVDLVNWSDGIQRTVCSARLTQRALDGAH
jgi:hypothetical protein